MTDNVVPFRPQPPIPGDWELDTAIEWLRLNEAAGGQAEACRVVAHWIEAVTAIRKRRPVPCNHDPADNDLIPDV
jgi:hypothetical protein